MKQVPTFVTVQIDYDRRLVLTADQAAVVMKAIQGAPIVKREGYSGPWVITDEVIKFEVVRADQILDEAPKTEES